ncbi:MAG: amidohydrolase family protein [Sedimentisphaerales bacterium]|jgi:predicted TIM-barrel fold metal-dependent hydrolase
MRIWDLHCHLPSAHMQAGTLSEQLERMLEIAGRVGIEKLGLFLRTGQADGPHSDREILRALTRHEGRVFGFVWCDLFEVRESIDKLKRWVGDGPMIGLKLGGYSGICSKLEYDPVFRQAIELKAVIYQHTWIKLGGDPPYPGGGNLPKESTPMHLVEVAKRYPGYPMICGHTGGDWEMGVRAVRASKNLSVGVGGGYPTRGMVEMAVRELGSERVIYGSDVTGRSFATQVGKVAGAAIPERHKALIFSKNFRRLLQPILKAKGIKISNAAA